MYNLLMLTVSLHNKFSVMCFICNTATWSGFEVQSNVHTIAVFEQPFIVFEEGQSFKIVNGSPRHCSFSSPISFYHDTVNN